MQFQRRQHQGWWCDAAAGRGFTKGGLSQSPWTHDLDLSHLLSFSLEEVLLFCLGPDHVQFNWEHKSIGNISQLETRPLIG